MLARNLHESAVAALRAALREDRAGEGGLAVGPQHNLAAVAAPLRRRADGGAGVDAHRGRGRDGEAFELGARVIDEACVRLAAAPVAADEHLAAAGGIDARVRELDVLAAHQNRAALRALLLSRCRER